MIMDKINLLENHRRTVSSSIYMIEEFVRELEMELVYPTDRVMQKLKKDIAPIDLQHYDSIIKEIKSYILYMATK